LPCSQAGSLVNWLWLLGRMLSKGEESQTSRPIPIIFIPHPLNIPFYEGVHSLTDST